MKTGQPALIFHSAGNPKTFMTNDGVLYFDAIRARFFRDKSIRNRFRRPPELEIIMSHNYRQEPLCGQGLRYIGINDFVQLGAGITPWKNVFRFKILYEYLSEKSRAPYVLHLDARDVLVMGDPSEILRRFLSLDCAMLFNAEKGSFPAVKSAMVRHRVKLPENIERMSRIESFEEDNYRPPFIRLNGGCFIGRREKMLEFLREGITLQGFISEFPNSDQAVFRELHRRHFPEIRIDDECLIFQNLLRINRGEIKLPYTVSRAEVFLRRNKAFLRRCLHRAVFYIRFIGRLLRGAGGKR